MPSPTAYCNDWRQEAVDFSIDWISSLLQIATWKHISVCKNMTWRRMILTLSLQRIRCPNNNKHRLEDSRKLSIDDHMNISDPLLSLNLTTLWSSSSISQRDVWSCWRYAHSLLLQYRNIHVCEPCHSTDYILHVEANKHYLEDACCCITVSHSGQWPWSPFERFLHSNTLLLIVVDSSES